MGKWRYVYIILDLGNRWSLIGFRLLLSYFRGNNPLTDCLGTGWATELAWCCGEDKKSLPEIEPQLLNRPAFNSSLYRLRYRRDTAGRPGFDFR
jgi:hypothetical protein